MPTKQRSSIRTQRLVAVLASGALLVLLAFFYNKTEDTPPLPAAEHTRTSTQTRFGPGAWTQTASENSTPSAAVTVDTNAPGGLLADSDQHLVVNKALKDVADYFLLGGHPGTRTEHAARLLAHLKASLPAPAYDEAADIGKKYLTYLDNHDKLLERSAMSPVTPDSMQSPADVERIGAWLAQRSRLRQDVLGLQVAKIFFGDEEAQDQIVLAALRQRGNNAMSQAIAASVRQPADELQALREKNTSHAEQRQFVLNQFGEQAAQRFDAIEGKEQAWKTRYASYRQTVENLRRQPGIDTAERERLIETLRAQTFTTEPERLRAANLDTLPPP